MSHRQAEVLPWPSTVDKAQDLLIIAVDTPHTLLRDAARQLVRSVLRDILGEVELISVPGQPIRVARVGSRIGISVSHESGLSLVAINFAGPVGIDLLRIPEDRHWQTEVSTLAADYLGPETARRIAELPPSAQAIQFAEAWTTHEASLKSLGLELTEWNTALAEKLLTCRTQKLALPAAYISSVATLRADENPAV